MLSSFVSHASRSCARFVLLALTVPLTVVSASAQQPPPSAPPAFVVGTLPDNSDPPVIDGRVTDAVWQSVKPYTDFTQQDPTEGAPASERTEVRLMVGRGTRLRRRSSASTATRRRSSCRSRGATRRSTDTDSVIMIFDTFNDNQNAFVFGTNPLGIEYDGQVAREGQTSGIVHARRGRRQRRRDAARRHQRVQPELGRRLDREGRR